MPNTPPTFFPVCLCASSTGREIIIELKSVFGLGKALTHVDKFGQQFGFFFITPAEYRVLFLRCEKVLAQKPNLQKKTRFQTLQVSLPLRLQAQVRRGRAGGKKPRCRFDLRPRLSAHRAEEGRGTEAQTPRCGEKVITLPPLLMCVRPHASAAEAEANRRVNCNFVSAVP